MNIGKLIKVKVGDIKAPECITWSEEQLEMVDNIVHNYDSNIGVIRISKDYKVIDGNHRLCILWEEYGDEYEIDVKQLPITRTLHHVLLLIFLPILLPIGIITMILKQIKKKNGIK
jgi:hypothetical protein